MFPWEEVFCQSQCLWVLGSQSLSIMFWCHPNEPLCCDSKSFMQPHHAVTTCCSLRYHLYVCLCKSNWLLIWINACICNHQNQYVACNQVAPSQSAEPLILSPAQEWPFQKLCSDYFEQGFSYLAVVDQIIYWLNIYHLSSTTITTSITRHLQSLFTSYGLPEEIAGVSWFKLWWRPTV